jgi:hypothetical protein
MRTLARLIRPRDWLVVGPACAAMLVGLVLTVPWVTHGPVLHHLWITWQYLLNGAYVVLMYNLQVTQEDLWKRRRRRVVQDLDVGHGHRDTRRRDRSRDRHLVG